MNTEMECCRLLVELGGGVVNVLIFKNLLGEYTHGFVLSFMGSDETMANLNSSLDALSTAAWAAGAYAAVDDERNPELVYAMRIYCCT